MTYSCDKCGKEFKFKSKLLEHLNRKTSCASQPISTPSQQLDTPICEETQQLNTSDQETQQLNTPTQQKDVKKDRTCEKCDKVFQYPWMLKRHINKCRGNPLQCQICLKFFSSRQSRNNHRFKVSCFPPDNVKCKSIEESQPQIQTQNNITTQQNAETINNINNTYAPVYNITYVKETGSMICDNPQLDDNELLCIEGFQREAIINKRLNNMDYPKLNRLTMNVIEYEEYDEFFKFLFRDDKNRRMHFMTLGKNAGATCCEAFRAGKIEKFEKDQFFNRVMGYICGHLTIMNNKFAPLNQLLFSKKSKRSFENALRTPSEHYQLFLED